MQYNNPNPELEANVKYLKGSRLDKFFDILSTAGYAAGGVDYYRQEAIARADSSVERALINVAYGIPVAGLAIGLSTKSGREAASYGIENRLEVAEVRRVEGFWGSLATNIAYDPLSYVSVGAVRGVVSKVGASGIKMLPKAKQAKALILAGKIGKVDTAIVSAKNRVANVAMNPIRQGTGWVVRGIVSGAGGAARRAEKILRRTGSKLGGIRDVFGEVFEPGYKIKKLGARMKTFYEDYQDMQMTRRGAVSQAYHEVVELGRPFKRAGETATDYIESGISTGVKGLDEYLENVVKPYIAKTRIGELAEGLEVGEVIGYAPRVLAKEGKKMLEQFGGDEQKTIEYLLEKARVGYGKERTVEGSIREINERLGGEFFVQDLWVSLASRAKAGAKDRKTAQWLREVSEEYGLKEGVEKSKVVLTEAAKKAQYKLHSYLQAETAFRNLKEDVLGTGNQPWSRLEDVVNRGKRTVFAGKWKEAKDIVKRIEVAQEARNIFRDTIEAGKRNIEAFELKLEKEADPTKPRGTIRREYVEDITRLIEHEKEKILGLEIGGLKGAEGELRGLLTTVQRDILDPMNLDITKIREQATATKVLRTVKTATDDAMDYVDVAHPDVSVKLPKAIAELIEETMETVSVDKTPVEKGLGLYRSAMQQFKKLVTVGISPAIRIGFFARNITTGIQANAAQIGIARTARGMYDAARLWVGHGTFETAEHGAVDAETMKRMMRESGIMDSSGMSDIDIQQKMYPTLKQKITGLGGTAMQWSESFVRQPLFLEESRKLSGRGVRKSVTQTHFDYSPEALTATEQAWTTYVQPFYKWFRFNTERQLKLLANKPDLFNRYGKIQRESIRTAGLEEEYEARPEWLQNRYLLASPLDEKKMIAVSVPLQDLMVDPQSMYFGISPIKNILELGAIESGWGTKEYKREQQMKVLENLLLGSYIRRFKSVTSQEKSISEKVLYESGISSYEVKEQISFDEFEKYRHRTFQPTKEQEYAAWVLAGQPENFKIVQLGEAREGMGVEADKIIKAPWWKVWEKDEVIKAPEYEFDMVFVTPEVQKMGKGYKLTEDVISFIKSLPEDERSAEYTKIVTKWDAWKKAQYGLEPVTTQEKMLAWERSGRPQDAIDKIYRNLDGKVVGIASYSRGEMDEISGYLDKHIQLSNAAFEWAFSQSDMPPEEFILQEYRKANVKYLDAKAARDELNDFDVDAPISAYDVNPTQASEYSVFRTNRVDYEQSLIERAMSRGETS